MMTQITPVELELRQQQTEIQKKTEDTPRSVDVIRSQQSSTGRTYANTLLALATATQIFGSSETGITDHLLSSEDMTSLSNEGPPTDGGEFFVPCHATMLEVDQEDEDEVANRTRLELLARLYVNKKLSAEENARLEIVKEKVRRLIPRVTVEDFETLGEIAQDAETVRKRIAERRRRLGI
jgi:hypothetical protein